MQDFLLAAHAVAVVAGHEVRLEAYANRFLRQVEEWAFYVPGPNGAKLAKSPNEFFVLLRSTGVDAAWFDLETALPDRYWGLVTNLDGQRFHWELDGSRQSENGKTWIRGSFRASYSPNYIPRPEVDIRAVAEETRAALRNLHAFSAEHRNDVEFLPPIEKSLSLVDALLAGDETLVFSVGIDDILPTHAFTREAILLANAIFEAPRLGGMGSWNDWSSPIPEVQALFQEATWAYANAIGPALRAVSLHCRSLD